MKNRAKAFDSVRMMREIRDTLSRETSAMNYEEQKRHMRERRRPDQKKNPQPKS